MNLRLTIFETIRVFIFICLRDANRVLCQFSPNFNFTHGFQVSLSAFHLMAWPVRPEFFSLCQWKDLVYVSQISSENGHHSNVIQIFRSDRSKAQMPVLCFIQQFDRSGRVNPKRPLAPCYTFFNTNILKSCF
jgi:hypothetical protein